MNFELKDIVTWGGTIGGLLGVWFRNQYKIERLEERAIEQTEAIFRTDKEYIRQVEALWKWKDQHERDALDTREKLNKDISELNGKNLVLTEKFTQIMTALIEIKAELIELKKSK